MTRSEQDYLKTIYSLGGAADKVPARLVSETLGHSKPAVSEMFKRLVAKGYAIYEPYQGIRLTESGLKEASKVLRRHRLWELWLLEELGYPLQEVHEEAERLEHVMSDRLEEALYQYLGNPKRDPHGHPIPDVDGTMEVDQGDPLAAFNKGDTVKVERVDDEYELLSYFQSLGLRVGMEILIEDMAPYEGPLTIQMGNKRTIVGYRAATRIYANLA